MKILVLSDSHHRADAVDKILSREQTCNEVFFLGDFVSDIEDYRYIYPKRNFHIVSGNCDYMSFYQNAGLEKIEGVSIFYTHGHTYYVKSGSDYISNAAAQRNCHIALYGHTHIPSIEIKNGIFIINPGSCGQSRKGGETYAVIDITDGNIYPEIRNL